MAKQRLHWLWSAALAGVLMSVPQSAEADVTRPSVSIGSGSHAAGFFTAGAQGATYELPGGSRVRLEPGSTVRVFHVGQKLTLGPGPQTMTWTILLRSGRMHVDVPVRTPQTHAVLVAMPRKLSAIAVGGRLTAAVSDRTSALANNGGVVLTSTGEGYSPLVENERRRIGRGDSGDVRAVLAPPKPVADQRSWIAPTGAHTLGPVSWQPLEGASSYEVTLRRKGQSEPLQTARTNEPRFNGFASVDPGIYEASVTAFDSDGLSGRPSAPLELRVIGVDLPPGAFASADGTLYLAPGQKAQFTHVEGLSMTYRGVRRYHAASRAVGLYRNERTTVYFRLPGSTQPASAVLAPRDIVAKVVVGPKLATWPNDPITIRIRLERQAGRPMPEWLEVVPKVTLGIDPVDVTWERRGDELTGTVMPRRQGGPWVVRVDVQDQFGIPLGRDFVEVIETPRAPAPSPQDRAYGVVRRTPRG
jgi:hypothetical protein